MKEKKCSGQLKKVHEVIAQNQNGNKDDHGVYTSRNHPLRSSHLHHLHVEIPADGNTVSFFMEDDLVQNHVRMRAT